MLNQLELESRQRDLLLRLQVRRPLGLWSLRLVVARPLGEQRLQLFGELKGWAYGAPSGLQLDTMRVSPDAPVGTGDLIWAAVMAWALETTPCRRARLLAIRDDERQHRRLVRYFQSRGFRTARELNAAAWDLPLRMVWGGAGALMVGDCEEVQRRAIRRWRQSAA